MENEYGEVLKQIKALFAFHNGEARTFSLLPEKWYKLKQPAHPLSAEDLGSKNYQFEVLADDVADIYSPNYTTYGCSPNFDRPISTFIVEDQADPQQFCRRAVTCCTLPELFAVACDKFPFETIYETWKEGLIVARRLHARGTKGRRLG